MNYFDPTGPAVTFTASTTAPTSKQASSVNGVQTAQVMAANLSSNVGVMLGWGKTDADAQAAAGSSTSPNQFFLAPGQQRIVVGRVDGFYCGVTTTLSATVYVQPGVEG